MSNYTKTTNFATKDSLASGNPNKIVKGTEINSEFDNIATAVATKANTASPSLTGTVTAAALNVTGNLDVDGTLEFDSISGTGSVAVTDIADEDNMSSNSATKLATQQSIKAYVDSQVTAQDLDLTDGSTSISIDLDSETLSVLGGTGVTSTASGNGVTLAIDSTVTTLTGSQTLTNKTLTSPDVNTPDIDGGTIDGTVIGGATAAAGSFTTVGATGNITVGGTVDGRDVATDGTKLDGIEASADVTDTANVTAAGALMDSELTAIASVKALNQGVATTDSPTFAAVTVNGNVEFDGLSGTGSVTVTDILDQDDMSGNSATALATQQSIKAYVDAQQDTVDTLAEILALSNATGGTDIAVGTGDDITFADNSKAIFGAGSDLQIYHDGSNSYIAESHASGNLFIKGTHILLQNSTGQDAITLINGDAYIKSGGQTKLATNSGGISVTGEVAATSLDISGDIDVDGTTNLDVVDIDGAVDMASTLAVASTLTVASSVTSTSSNIIAGTGTDAIQTFRMGSGNSGANKASINFQNSASGEIFALDFDNSTGTFDISSDLSGKVASFGRSGGVTFNQDSNDYDFRVESNGNTHMLFVDAGNDAAFFGGSDKRGFVNIETTPVNYSAGVFNAPHLALQASSQPDDNDGFVGITFATSDSDNYGWSAGAERTSSGVGDFVFTEHNNSATGSEKLRLTQSGAATFSGDVSVPNISVADDIRHTGDSDTYISFETNNQTFYAGNTRLLDLTSGNVTFNEGGGDVDFRVESSGNANMLFVDGGNNQVGIGTSSTSKTLTVSGDAIITTGDNSATLTLQSTDADANAGPLLVLDRQSASPADGDVLGQIQFNGKNDTAEAHGYAKIEARIVDASNATEDGRLELMTSVATEEGISRILMNATETVINDNSKDLDFRVESDGNANMLFVDGENNRVGIGRVPATHPLEVEGHADFKSNIGVAGNIAVASGNGILLGGTATANKLSDFETGSFTPTWIPASGSGQTIAAASGHYTKVGNRVFVDIYLATNGHGTASGNLTLGGLPFTQTTNSGQNGSLSCGQAANAGLVAGQSGAARVNQSATTITPLVWDAAAGTTTMTAAQWGVSGTWRFTGSYQV